MLLISNMDLVYILTNEVDAANDVFKVGKTRSDVLAKRLSAYNTGASSPYYYAVLLEVRDGLRTERIFHDLMASHRLGATREMYRAPFSYLKRKLIETAEWVRRTDDEDPFAEPRAEVPAPLDVSKHRTDPVRRPRLDEEEREARRLARIAEAEELRRTKLAEKEERRRAKLAEEEERRRAQLVEKEERRQAKRKSVDQEEVAEWLDGAVVPREGSFVQLSELARAFVSTRPGVKTTDVERMIDASFNAKGVYMKERFRYIEDCVKREQRRVYFNFDIVCVDDEMKELEEWLDGVVVRSEGDFVKRGELVRRFIAHHPNTRIRDVEAMIDEAFIAKGVHAKKQYKYKDDDGVVKNVRRVYDGFKFRS